MTFWPALWLLCVTAILSAAGAAWITARHFRRYRNMARQDRERRTLTF